MTDPYLKSRQLARGARRYRRKVASPKQWQAIIAEKGVTCRLEGVLFAGKHAGPAQFHHLIPRARGGDDVAANIVPLCPVCHDEITKQTPVICELLAAHLTDEERAYVLGKAGA